MKWLFFISKKSDTIKEISSLLKKHKAECTTVYIEDLPSETVSDEFVDILHDTDYVIFNFDSKFSNNINYIFALGYVEGEQLVSFSNMKTSFESDVYIYKDFSDLLNLFNEHVEDYVALEEKNKAETTLVESGIPFTPDCFSFEIAKNNMKTAKLFLKAGMSANERDSSGIPMICIATRAERKEMIEWLIENGAEINAVSKDRGYSAVMDAVWKHSEKLVEYFIEKGAELNLVGSDGQTALIIATGIGNEKICRMLVSHGADPYFKDHMNMSSIDYANLFKKTKLIELYKEYSK